MGLKRKKGASGTNAKLREREEKCPYSSIEGIGEALRGEAVFSSLNQGRTPGLCDDGKYNQPISSLR